MPGGDGTGPMGAGPMTGRGAGYCAGNAMPGYANPVSGRGSRLRPAFAEGYGGQVGMGFGRGFAGRGRGGGPFGGLRAGWGRRNWFYATGMPGWAQAGPSPEQELDALKGQAGYLSGVLESIKTRIEELMSGQATE